jgi:hypothetical protein
MSVESSKATKVGGVLLFSKKGLEWGEDVGYVKRTSVMELRRLEKKRSEVGQFGVVERELVEMLGGVRNAAVNLSSDTSTANKRAKITHPQSNVGHSRTGNVDIEVVEISSDSD